MNNVYKRIRALSGSYVTNKNGLKTVCAVGYTLGGSETYC